MSKRIIKISGDEDEEPTLDISSLIDVAFLLLIYFLVTSSLLPKEVDLGLSLPSDIIAPPAEERPLTLRLNEDGSVVADPTGSPQPLGTADSDTFEFPELVARLQTYKSAADQRGQNAGVVLLADDNANTQQLLNVFNAINGVGITNVTLTGFRE